MDRSMDSIGSCSLDVDADSSELSDTSGSLNFPTPLSVKDITREFTANIRERCTLRSVAPPSPAPPLSSTTAIVDPVTGQVRMVLTQPTQAAGLLGINGTTTTTTTAAAGAGAGSTLQAATRPPKHQNHTPAFAADDDDFSTAAAAATSGGGRHDVGGGGGEKKPSYLNLACCVNGYSNLTTYDSKIRQDINKSREVSPIRPSVSQALQYCKRNNSLAPPVLHAMPDVTATSAHTATAPLTTQPHAGNGTAHYSSTYNYNYNTSNYNGNNSNSSNNNMNHQTPRRAENGGLPYASIHLNGHHFALQPEGGEEADRRPAVASVIQQRVERLYGPGALAQGFYSPKKVRSSPNAAGRLSAATATATKTPTKTTTTAMSARSPLSATTTLSAGDPANEVDELTRKFHELSPNNRDYSQFRKKLDANVARAHASPGVTSSATGVGAAPTTEESTEALTVNGGHHQNSFDLPCLRHLPQEFRDQLPSISPKRHLAARPSPPRSQESSPRSQAHDITSNGTSGAPVSNGNGVPKVLAMPSSQPATAAAAMTTTAAAVPSAVAVDEVDRQVRAAIAFQPLDSNIALIVTDEKEEANVGEPAASRDGNHFLVLLRAEQARLLVLAGEAEKYLAALANNPDISEDTLGFLRSAAGKARLLVTQKMKQFEGLCYKNLTHSPLEKFPTTVDDLQGFWDMVYLQVDHVDAIFAEIEVLRNNDWKLPKSIGDVGGDGGRAATGKANTQTRTNKTGTGRAAATKSNGCAAANGGGGAGAGKALSAAALKREAQRKQLLEMKRKNRQAIAAAEAEPGDIIAAPAMTNNGKSNSSSSNDTNTITSTSTGGGGIPPAPILVASNSIEMLIEEQISS